MFHRIPVVLSLSALLALPLAADTFSFSTGDPNGLIATGSRPSSNGKIEIESADDFVLTAQTSITSATFTGLLTGATPTVGDVTVEIYRVFPKDSTVPPSSNVLTRVNSPSDIEFADRDAGSAGLTFTTSVQTNSFTANNSVLNGINKFPNQTTGGEGPVTGLEVEFTVKFTPPKSNRLAMRPAVTLSRIPANVSSVHSGICDFTDSGTSWMYSGSVVRTA